MLFHKKARKHRWDVEKYNRIKQVNNQRQILQLNVKFLLILQGINTVELDLQKIRDPLQIHVPAAKKGDKSFGAGGGFFGINNLRDVISKLQ